MDLFSESCERSIKGERLKNEPKSEPKNEPKSEPLASRMRPRKLAEFIGQSHLLEGFLLRVLEKEASSQSGLSNIVLWGPPGSGKTTLALLLARETQRSFLRLSAVLDGLKELRACLKEAQQSSQKKAPILFVDEIHRWNKAQQDALLPWVEQGTVLLVGATTENPAFELNNALLSRVRIVELSELKHEDLQKIAQAALLDEQRGLGNRVSLQPQAQDYLIEHCSGDARRLLNALELIAQIYEDGSSVNVAMARQCLKRQNLYDRSGDYHYDSISAFIKSVRGSSIDDALYWLQVMLQGGEDPSFILRRLLILAAEDVGLADPQALVQVQAAAQAFERVGLPEGEYFLSQATIYLALAPKSNSIGAFWQAKAAVKEHGPLPVPLHLRSHAKSAHKRRAEATAIRAESTEASYLYPHDYSGNWIEQAYSDFHGKFYQAGTQGWERARGREWQRRREILAEARRLDLNLKKNSKEEPKPHDEIYWENRHELLLAWDELRSKLAHALPHGETVRFIGREPLLDDLLQWLEPKFLQANYPSEEFLQQAWKSELAETPNYTAKTLIVNHLFNWPALFLRFAQSAQSTNSEPGKAPDKTAGEFWEKFRQHIKTLAQQKTPQILFFGDYPCPQEASRILQQLDSANTLGDLRQKLEQPEPKPEEFLSFCHLQALQKFSVSYEQTLHPKLWYKLGKSLPEELRECWLQAYSALIKSKPRRVTLIKHYALYSLFA